jgi:hypothetical protein
MFKMLKQLAIALGLVLGGALVALGATLPLPAVNGPYLGDQNNNLYQITLAYIQGAGYGQATVSTIDQTIGQTNCTPTGLSNNMLTFLKTSASTGYICLPPAIAGRRVEYYNGTGQTINIYGSNSPFVAGTADTINTTAGSTAYASMTTGKNTVCFAYANGAWSCSVSTQ